jgi:hypothetical protein
MKKQIEPQPDIARVVSMMGQNRFHKAVQQQLQAGVTPGEAPVVVARMKLKGLI